MIDNITPERIANAIRQNVSHKGTYLIVEGILDEIFFSKFKFHSCEIVIAFGKKKVTDSIANLNATGYNKALGIIDSDFSHIDKEPIEENVVVTDFHDLEMMAIQSKAFEAVLTIYASRNKLISLIKEKGKPVKDVFLELATPLGFLKLANNRENLGLAFKGKIGDRNRKDLDFKDFIDFDTMSYVDEKLMIKATVQYTRNRGFLSKTEAIVYDAYKNTIDNSLNLYQLCNGHDICTLISLACRKKINNLNAHECLRGDIEKDLILSYDSSEFIKTTLYKSIKKWEDIKTLNVLDI